MTPYHLGMKTNLGALAQRQLLSKLKGMWKCGLAYTLSSSAGGYMCQLGGFRSRPWYVWSPDHFYVAPVVTLTSLLHATRFVSALYLDSMAMFGLSAGLSNVVVCLLSFVYVQTVLTTSTFLVKQKILSSNNSRKVIHVAAGSWLMWWPFFDDRCAQTSS